MKWYGNVLILAASIPLLIAGLIVVAVLFLGASAVVFFRRVRHALIA
jgi:hypothetical protein